MKMIPEIELLVQKFDGKVWNPIRCRWVKSSKKPNTKEKDFCVNCLRYLLDNKILYTDTDK